jgi:hypothetical protein
MWIGFAERPGSRSRIPTAEQPSAAPINAEVYRFAESYHTYTAVNPPQSGNTPRYSPAPAPRSRTDARYDHICPAGRPRIATRRYSIPDGVMVRLARGEPRLDVLGAGVEGLGDVA